MSYDIDLRETCAHCKHEQRTEQFNITYNLSPMISEALGCGLRDLNGKEASEIEALLEKGVLDMRARPNHYAEFNPPNGWGTYDGLLLVFTKLLSLVREHPNAKVAVR